MRGLNRIIKSKIFSGMPIANTDWSSVSDFRIAADRSDISPG